MNEQLHKLQNKIKRYEGTVLIKVHAKSSVGPVVAAPDLRAEQDVVMEVTD
jgi:hypothetical protein